MRTAKPSFSNTVRAALAYVARGETTLGVVYNTDAQIEPRVHIVGTFPDNSHAPIVYPVALVKDAKPGASDFEKFLSSDAATDIFRKYGFNILKH